MSAKWGELSADAGLRDLGSSAGSKSNEDRPADAGAWPESMPMRFVAETSMTLPGMGEAGPGCGQWYPQEFCDECGEPRFGESRCEQRGCPDCGNTVWRRRRSEKVATRLGAARHVADEPIEKRAVHAVVSPPEGEIQTLVDVQRGFRDAYGLAKEKGVRGGVAVFHGFRVTERGKRMYEDAKDEGDWCAEDDGKLWAFVRRHEERVERGIGGGDWRALSYWSPHWHIIGLAEEFEADDPDAQGGWVARRIRSLERFTLHREKGYEDMVGTSMYLLSHATFESDSSSDCVRWFGELATTQFSPENELTERELETVERKAAEAAGAGPVDGEHSEPCECAECGSVSFSPIWEAGAALIDKSWTERIGRRQQQRLAAAFEWAIGDRQPPPGLKNPRSEEEALEAFEAVL